MATGKRTVYVLKSAGSRAHFYVGLTHSVEARLASHNAGRCPHTTRHRPWALHGTIHFPDEHRAVDFERYLKSGSGRAFAKLHFADSVADPSDELPASRMQVDSARSP